MEIYENENDQVEAVKRFFAENGKALAVGVILGVGALIGWRYWNSHQGAKANRIASRRRKNLLLKIKIPMVRWLLWNLRSNLLTKMN